MTTRRRKDAPVGDRTRTKRAKAHLERLADAKGKRILVDLGEIEREALDLLVETGYGANQSDAVRRAIVEAAERQEAPESDG
jgi:ribosomal protein S12 methylthiotransferase accessory factor YcaO